MAFKRGRPTIGRRRRTANFAFPRARPAAGRRRRLMMNKKKLRRISRRVNTGTAVHGRTRIDLGFTNLVVNVNHPANRVEQTDWSVFNINANKIDELTERSVIYSKFRIRDIKYIFVRDMIKTPQCISTAEYSSGPYSYCFPNTYNRLLPSAPSLATGTQATQHWCQQQTGVKCIPINKTRFTMKVKPKMTLNEDYQGPSGTTAGASVVVNRHVNCPWLDLNNDLLDNLSLGQLVFWGPPVTVTTTIPVATTAGALGPNSTDLHDMFNYRVYAMVSYSVKGRWLDKEVR